MKKILIYLNPANSNIEINFESKENGLINIQINNQIGSLVYDFNIEKNTNSIKKQINTLNFTNGIYYLKIVNIVTNEVYKDSFIIIH